MTVWRAEELDCSKSMGDSMLLNGELDRVP